MQRVKEFQSAGLLFLRHLLKIEDNWSVKRRAEVQQSAPAEAAQNAVQQQQPAACSQNAIYSTDRRTPPPSTLHFLNVACGADCCPRHIIQYNFGCLALSSFVGHVALSCGKNDFRTSFLPLSSPSLLAYPPSPSRQELHRFMSRFCSVYAELICHDSSAWQYYR